jgi:uncharacterized protein YlaI
MKPAHQITDRAKRYRAQNSAPPGPRRCTFCAARENIDIDHISGNEADGDPDNLMYLCRSCNTRKGVMQARNRVGIRTRQFNPAQVPTFSVFKSHIRVLLGLEPGNVPVSTAAIRATPAGVRSRYTDKIEASNPFKSDAQRRKFFAMAERGEISRATLEKFAHGNPSAPTFAQYAHGVSIHQRGAHDEGGVIIHATPAALRSRYAARIAKIKKDWR